jgi:hypothetical protein
VTRRAEFTPGPLTARGRRLESGSIIVAWAIVGNHTTFEQDDANAAEIARRWNAYPDLLAACESVLLADGEEWETGKRVLRAAVAKARGEQP